MDNPNSPYKVSITGKLNCFGRKDIEDRAKAILLEMGKKKFKKDRYVGFDVALKNEAVLFTMYF